MPHRRGGQLAVITIAVAGVELVLAVVWIVTRPPCAPGSARLLPLIPAVLIVLGLVCLVAAVLLTIFAGKMRRHRLVWLYRLFTIPCLVVAAVLVVGIVGGLQDPDHWKTYDRSCWTF